MAGSVADHSIALATEHTQNKVACIATGQIFNGNGYWVWVNCAAVDLWTFECIKCVFCRVGPSAHESHRLRMPEINAI